MSITFKKNTSVDTSPFLTIPLSNLVEFILMA